MRHNRLFIGRASLVLVLVLQPLAAVFLTIVSPTLDAQAANNSTSGSLVTQAQAKAGYVDAFGSSLLPGNLQPADPVEQADTSDDAGITSITPNYSPQTLSQVQTAFFGGDFTLPNSSSSNAKPVVPPSVLNAPPVVQLNPDDVNKLDDYQVDTRLTQYLDYLVAPPPLGAGLTGIKANIFKGYDTTGIGKYDRQTLAANLQNPTTVSPHSSGEAVDITSAGTITCKLVEHRLIGGSTTHWQPAMPVKIAWQSPSGIANNPVPTGDSLVGTAGTMTASGILNYLNNSGQLDTYIDYAKGLSVGQIGEYVGANVLLKSISTTSVQLDPLASSVIGSIGTQSLLKQLPGLPTGINGEVGSDDIRISAAKAQIEDGLGLPSGSLAGLGWQSLLTNTGKRQLEQALSLPTNYLNTHDPKTLATADATKAAFSYVSRNDDALNFIPGTVAALQKGDPKGLEMAAVNAITKAFKLSTDQTKVITDAISKNQSPKLDPIGLNTGNQISVDGLKSLLSDSSTSQQAALNELKTIGLTIFQKAASGAVPSQFSGLTSSLLSQILNPATTVSQTDATNQMGVSSLLSETDVDPILAGAYANAAANQRSTATSAAIATGLNNLFNLTGSATLTASDVNGMFTAGNTDALNKLGGAELDRGFQWAAGTGQTVISDPTKLDGAMKQTFANSIGALLGLTGSNFSLNGNPSQDLGLNLIAQRFGLTGFAGNTTAANLLGQLGSGKFKDLFGVSSLSSTNWDDPTLNSNWTENDILLGVPTGTTKSYLQGKIDGTAYAQTAGDDNLSSIPPDQFFNQFGLTGDFAPDSGNTGAQKNDLKTITDALKSGKIGNQALSLINQVVGRSVDAKANFTPDDFTKIFSAAGGSAQVTAILDAGLKLFGRSMGANLPSYTDQQIDGIMGQVKGIFNSGAGVLSPTDPNFLKRVEPLTQFFLDATGIPKQFTADANNFLLGDYKTGLADLSFILWQKNINQYLPGGAQLAYQELRDTLGITDQTAINQEVNVLTTTTDSSGHAISVAPTPETYDQARQILNTNASQNVQYKMSDSFLRKVDPTVPAGFTKAMFSGSDADRATMLQTFAFNNIDTALKKINPAYVPGTLASLFSAKTDAANAGISLFGSNTANTAINSLVTKSGVTLGPLNSADLGNLVSYFATPKANQNILTDKQFLTTWGNMDKWLSSSIGIGTLPTGISRSIYYASQNGWNFNSSLKNQAGTVIIPSVNSLATDFATAKLTGWADKELHLPAGSIFQLYTAGKAVIGASQFLALAHLSGDSATISAASTSLSKAQASLTLLAITTALQICATCQAFFSSVDAAIHAPPGFTNAAVAGAIAAAMHLGYMGLYVAAAIYLFGVNSTSYECPKPPVDQYAITSFDQGADALSYGYTPGVDGPTPPNSNPAPGQNPFDWDNNVPFVNATNQVWEGWARYFTGKLLDATISYGGGVSDFNKPLQVLTYRQANVEYFAPREAEGFGAAAKGSNKVGMGFTQTSTKTTDYVYVSFGGYF